MYDAIVVGTGISGGWAAKELCENGLKTLVLERGRMVTHIKDYPTANLDPWDMPNNGDLTPEQKSRQEKQARTGYTVRAESSHWFVDDVHTHTMKPSVLTGCVATTLEAVLLCGGVTPTDGVTWTLKPMPKMA